MAQPVKVKSVRRNKYNAKKSEGSDGFVYDSIAERRYGDLLLDKLARGRAQVVMRQVPFWLPGPVRLVLDFVWVDDQGVMHFEDVKSPPTEAKSEFRAKKRMVEARYGIKIDVVWGKA